MAVEKSRLVSRFRIKFPKVNLSNERLNEIADRLSKKPADDADDAAIDLVLDEANELLSFEDIAKSDDRLKNAEALAKKNAEKKDDKTEVGKKDEEVVDVDKDAPEWAKAMLEQNKKLASDLEALKTGKVIETKKQNASELFAKSEVLKRIPEGIRQNWVNRIDVNSETPFEEQIQALETEYSTLVQVNADNNQYSGPAGNGSADIKADDAVVDAVVNI
jgi:hypothetical protein